MSPEKGMIRKLFVKARANVRRKRSVTLKKFVSHLLLVVRNKAPGYKAK